ncbi:GGDEF domain-containing protein [Actinocrispum wychmicini]|uniref:Diguanylate cyclase (GGDEF)-like protein n=1 Tax=Actinocrispum wychmicini TaxID=1213861 RepID=A0A4R2JX14_9PSEU|nr:GGDEF domain-containing protein [Actinocrispum wychmicini]TCO65071.1 diguanylate cyclase (GGDEF)-like protein [Actinocrispum wychmicini]
MTGLGRGVAEPEPVSDPVSDAAEWPDQGPGGASTADGASLVQLHESIATLLASRGQWRQAYQHLRSALELVHADRTEPPHIPEQLRREVDRLRREHAEAREQSIRDSLTASYNRRYLDQRLVTLLSEWHGRSGGLAVSLVDLDWFKQVNDTFGHLIGDRVLQHVVELLQEGLPEDAFCARYGGEEFALVLPGVDGPAAVAMAEAARIRVENHPWTKIVLGLRVTVSIGIAYEPMPGIGVGPERQLRQADGLLYTAKQSGRNAVAYQVGGRTFLAGPAAGRRAVTEPRALAF